MNAPVHNNKVQLVNIRQNVGSYEIYKRHVFFFFYLGLIFATLPQKKTEGAQGIKGFLMEKMGTSCHIMRK
jgi:hypothetical protein